MEKEPQKKQWVICAFFLPYFAGVKSNLINYACVFLWDHDECLVWWLKYVNILISKVREAAPFQVTSDLIIRLWGLKRSRFIQGYRRLVCRFSLDGCKCTWLPDLFNYSYGTLRKTSFHIYQPVHLDSPVGKDIASWSLSSTLQSKVQILILEDSTIWSLQRDQPVLFKLLCGEAGSSSGRRSKTALWYFSEGSQVPVCCGATILADGTEVLNQWQESVCFSPL